MPLVTWPTVSGLRIVAGGGPRGRRLRCRWVTWLAVSGLRTVAGGGRLLRGWNFNSTVDVSMWADAGRWARAARRELPTNDGTTWDDAGRGVFCEAGGFTADGDMATLADAGSGRVLRGRWRHCRWRRGRWWLSR